MERSHGADGIPEELRAMIHVLEPLMVKLAEGVDEGHCHRPTGPIGRTLRMKRTWPPGTPKSQVWSRMSPMSSAYLRG